MSTRDTPEAEGKHSQGNGKRKVFAVLFALYLTFILISIIPYLAEQNLNSTRSGNETYVSYLTFPSNGTYGHYQQVTLTDGNLVGQLELEYTFSTNTLYIQTISNIKELTIDCQLLYENQYYEVFNENPSSLDTAAFITGNNGLFTVVINTDTPMDSLQLLGTPMPNSVMVNNVEWWDTNLAYYSVDNDDVTITYIPVGSTTIQIYFLEPENHGPMAMFTADNYIALVNEPIYFDASSSYDTDGSITDYIWSLGDSSNNISQAITHSYSAVGNYTVTLTVRDDDNAEDLYIDSIVVVESNQSFQDVVVDDVEINIRSVQERNISIEVESNPPALTESTGVDFGFFLNITSDDQVSRLQFKINLGFIGGEIIPAGTDPDSIKLFYYNESLNAWVVIEDSYYDPLTGILTAKVDHLTIFAPLSKETSREKKVDKDREDGGFDLVTIGALVLAVIVIISVFGIVIKNRKKGKGRGKVEGRGKVKGEAKTKTMKGGKGKTKAKGVVVEPEVDEGDFEDYHELPEPGYGLQDPSGLEGLQELYDTEPGAPSPARTKIRQPPGKRTKRSSKPPSGLLDDELPILTPAGKSIKIPPPKGDPLAKLRADRKERKASKYADRKKQSKNIKKQEPPAKYKVMMPAKYPRKQPNKGIKKKHKEE